MRTCLICGSDKEVTHLSTIYTIGSEGTDLCIDCRIAVSDYIRRMMAMKYRIEQLLRKEWAV
jgi:hypothetical protein